MLIRAMQAGAKVKKDREDAKGGKFLSRKQSRHPCTPPGRGDIFLFFFPAQRFYGVFLFQRLGTITASFLMDELDRKAAPAKIKRQNE